jgi:predicted RNA methylase
MDLETTRLQLQSDLDSQKTQTERNRLGQFATPPRLAAEIVKAGLSLLPSQSQISFLDPGFGTGSFYSALLKALRPEQLRAAQGFEIDPHYGEHAKALWGETPLQLDIADFTHRIPPRTEADKFNLIICNPPYVRHHHLNQTQKHALKAAVLHHESLNLSGLSGLYCYFLALSRAWMAKNGVAAWLIPSEFMDVNYGLRIKQFLLDRVTLLKIHRFDSSEVQFDDALVSSAIVFIRNSPPPTKYAVGFSYGGGILDPRVNEQISSSSLREIVKWTALPQTIRLESDRGTERTFADLFTIKRGLATGCNSFFVLPIKRAEQLRLPKQFLTPILPSPRYLESDEVLADQHGDPEIAKQLVLLSCDLSEEEIRNNHPTLHAYLETGREKGIADGYLCAHRTPWYLQENRPAAPYLCTYMGRPSSKSIAPFRFVLNHSRATAANVYLMLYPKPILTEIMKRRPELKRKVWQVLAAITSEAVTSEGRIYGGGLHKIEPKELAKLPATAMLDLIKCEHNWSRQGNLFV